MSALRFILGPLALLVSAAQEPVELRAVYTAGQILSATSEQWTTTTYDSIQARMDGELLPVDALGALTRSLLPERIDKHLAGTTTYDEVVDGAPVAARRHFDRLELREQRGEARKISRGVFEGRTLALRRGADGKVVARPALQDSEPDPRFLAGHLLTHPIERYLPAGPVTIGDRWHLPRERIVQATGLDGGTLYFESEKQRALLAEFFEAGGELSGEVHFDGIEMRDGRRCARLSAELTARLHATDLDPSALLPGARFDATEVAAALHFELKFTERLWFAIDAGIPVAASAEAAGSLRIEIGFDQDGHELELTIEASLAGANESRWKEESAT